MSATTSASLEKSERIFLIEHPLHVSYAAPTIHVRKAQPVLPGVGLHLPPLPRHRPIFEHLRTLAPEEVKRV